MHLMQSTSIFKLIRQTSNARSDNHEGIITYSTEHVLVLTVPQKDHSPKRLLRSASCIVNALLTVKLPSSYTTKEMRDGYLFNKERNHGIDMFKKIQRTHIVLVSSLERC